MTWLLKDESSSLEVTFGPENISSTVGGPQNVVILITGHKLDRPKLSSLVKVRADVHVWKRAKMIILLELS